MSKANIAVIDDDKVILKIVASTLQESGYTPHCYSNPAEGLRAVQEMKPDALILDRVMPDMDGNDIIAVLQADDLTRHIPIMMLTSLSEIADITASLGLGARDYIVKPFDQDNFIIRLSKLLSH